MTRSSAPARLTPLSVYVLLAIADEPLHGYGIIKHVEQQTRGALVIEAGTLYAAIKRMQDEGLMEADRRRRSERDDSRRRYYRLTPLGRKILRAECDRLADVLAVARQKRVLPAGGGR